MKFTVLVDGVFTIIFRVYDVDVPVTHEESGEFNAVSRVFKQRKQHDDHGGKETKG
jgi:hypothetical protein